MSLKKLAVPTPFVLILILLVAVFFGCGPRVTIASQRLPNVSPEMEHPEYWIKKIEKPFRILLSPEEIQKINEENLKRQDLFLCEVKKLKEEWTGQEILALMDEDWQGFGRTEEIRYGRKGSPLEENFWNTLKGNLNRESLKERNPMPFGLIVKRTDIRVFPTEEFSMITPVNHDFDRFQHSSISPGALVGIYHFSKDGLWAYIQCGFIRGWIRTRDLAIAKERREAVAYEERKERLLITGNFVNVFADPSLRQPLFPVQMGTSFPILASPRESVRSGPCYVIQIPIREADGGLAFGEGYIHKDEDVRPGFLPYHQANLARQAFKMLHQPYGWGEMFGARDCSRFIMDLFATFGIIMPRNSKLQARIGIGLGQVEGIPVREKERILDRAIPLATILRLPGHIMLYLGKDRARHYVIHNIYGYQKAGWFGPALKKVAKVVVSDLSLGRSGPYQSLLHRITDIQTIASESELYRKLP